MSKSAIAKGAIISYVSIVLNLVISFAYTPWMIHKIGVSDYGLYSLAASFIGYFILDFGMSSSIARFIAKYRAEGREDKVENMVGLTAKIYLAIDAVIFLVLFVLFFFVSGIFKGLTPDEVEHFKTIYIISGTFCVLSFVFKPMNGAMMAYEYFVENKLLDMVTRVGTVLLVMVALLLGGNVFFLVLINGAVGLGVSLTKFQIFKKKSRLKINWHYFEKDELKVLLSFSVWIFLMGLAQRFRFTLVQSVLGIFSNSTEISLFSLGMMLEGTVYNISAALNGLFLPKVTRLSQDGDKERITGLMIRVGRIQLFIIWLIFTGFVIFGKPFIILWVGEEFSKVYYILILLIASNVVSLTQRIADDLVMAENKVRTNAILIFIYSFLGIIGSVLTAKRFGAVGCAACTGIALCLYVVSINIVYEKTLKLGIGRFFKECHLKIIPLLTVLAVGFYFLAKYMKIHNWGLLIIAATAYTVVYVLISYFLLFNQEEKKLVNPLLNRIRR